MTPFPTTLERALTQIMFALAAWLVPAVALADCTARAARPAETAFHSRALSALVAALPPLPAGVQEQDAQAHDFGKPVAVRAVLCDFSKEGAFSVTARRVYVKRHGDAERRALQARYDALTAEFHAWRKTPAALVERQNALRQKSNEAFKAAREAEKAADRPGAQARDAEYRALRDEADAIDAQHQASVKPQTDDLDKRRTAIDLDRQRVEVRLAINVQRLPAAGNDATRGVFGVASPAQSAGFKVHNLTFAVDGNEGPLRQALTGAIDRARLASLVGQAPPDEAESGAVAARTAPVRVADIDGAANSSGSTAATSPVGVVAPAPVMARAASAAPAPASPVGTEAGVDPLQKATEAVNKLRGLLGR